MRGWLDGLGKKGVAIALVALLAFSTVGAAAGATMLGAGEVNFESDYAPNPEIDERTLEKDSHDVGDELVEYEGDNGETQTLDAHVNDSETNPISLRADKINASDYSRFPGDKSDVSALDAGEWATSGTSITVENANTAPEVEALRVSTSGLASGSSNSATFSNVSIDSDPNKRYLQAVVNINSISSGATVDVVFTDADGDDKVATINTSADASADDVIANSTGSGVVYQAQLGSLATTDHSVSASGDGSFDGVDSVSVVVSDGDADVTLAGLNGEKMGTWSFGEKKVDTDDDDELETVEITEPSGSFSIHSTESMGSTFDSSTIHDLRFPAIYSAADLVDDSDVSVEITETAEGKYPNYGFKVTAQYRLSVPNAYDLVHSGLTLRDTQDMPSDRYKEVAYAEGVGDSEFDEISSWTDVTSSYSSEGSDVTLDETVEPGKEYAVKYEFVATGSNTDEIEDTSAGAPGGGGKESGGILGSISAVIASILGVLGVGKLGSKISG